MRKPRGRTLIKLKSIGYKLSLIKSERRPKKLRESVKRRS
mgnify:CR=1 FL=1